MKSRLDNFEIIRHGNDCPFITLSKYGITFSKKAIECIGAPQYVHAFLNRKERFFAIQPAGMDKEAISFIKDEKAAKRSFVRWSNRSLQRELLELMGETVETGALRINGEYYADENLIIFNLCDIQCAQ